MKRYIVIGEIVLILLLTGLILLDFTGVGRENRKQYKEIDHISGDATPEVVSVAPLDGKDPYVYHVEGDKLVGPTPTSTPTPTPTPTLSPEEKYIRDGIERAYACTIPESIAFAEVKDYLSIRREPDGGAPRLGVMNPGDSCLVESVNGEWAYVKSGSILGYCLVEYLIRGEDAKQYAKEHVVYKATIIGPVNMRSEPTTQKDNVIATLEVGQVVTAKTPALRSDGDPTTPLFTEVELSDGRTGYIATNLAEITYSWPVAHIIDDRKKQ
ncbi:MAG: hypothetical protein J5738_07095 [Lachnospiraceae bacterium]|nr:hypothetical protein [Lachnospiraceae bacterium]